MLVEPLPPGVDLPVESGATFAENAALKATSVFLDLHSRSAVLADDSGLEVSALGGAPGVYSARYAGNEASDEDNIEALLEALEGVDDRSARFVCHLVLRLPAGERRQEEVIQAEGVLSGSISLTAKGEGGFGYDPVFVPTGWERALAEASPGEKDRTSHRSRAVTLVRRELQSRGLLAPDDIHIRAD